MARRSKYTPAVRPIDPPTPAVQMRALGGSSGMIRGSNASDSYDNEESTGKGGTNAPVEPMDDMEFDNLVQTAIQDGLSYDETQLQQDRLQNRRFYNGDISAELPADPEGSSIVSRDVRDAIHAMLPSMMRVFCTTENICELGATRKEDDEWVEQATNYLNYLWRTRVGEVTMYELMFDACLSKIGILKWRWDESERITEHDFSGLTPAEFAQVLTPERGEEIKLISYEDEDPVTAQDVSPGEDDDADIGANAKPDLAIGMPLTTCRIRRIVTTKRLVFEAVPPEERGIDPRARSLDTARFWFHRTSKTVGQLVDMGYDRDFVLDHATGDDSISTTEERALRQPRQVDPAEDDLPTIDQRQVIYVELYIYCDRDGDGHQELVKACCIGNAYAVAHEETVVEIPAAEFSLIPQPHIATGRCPADELIDMQVAKSGLQRNTFESLAHTVYPRMAIVERGVNMDDVLSTAPGQPYRMTAQGNVQPITTEFVGQQALQVAEYIDGVIERRTGVSEAAQGLDPDALQSTPAGAATAMVNAVQSQLEMYARMFAATGLKRFFRGVLREIVANQNLPDMIKLNGEWQSIDPRPWNADVEVRIKAGLGRGSDPTRLATLQLICQKQETILAQLGPNNPMVTMAQYRRTLAKIIDLGGEIPDLYFQPNPQAPPPQPPPPPPPNPAVQIAQMKLAAEKPEQDAKTAKVGNDQALAWATFERDTYMDIYKMAAQLGMQAPDPAQLIAALRMPPGTPLPTPGGMPYPIAPPTPALSPVHAPPGDIVPTPHIAGVAQLNQ